MATWQLTPRRAGDRGGCVRDALSRPAPTGLRCRTWTSAIDDTTFEDWVFEAIDALPAAFRERLGSVAIVIEEWPTEAQLASVGAAGLYGLYQGVPRSRARRGPQRAPRPRSRSSAARWSATTGRPRRCGRR